MPNRFQYPALSEPVAPVGSGGGSGESLTMDKWASEISQPLPKRKRRNAALASDYAFTFVYVPALIPAVDPVPVRSKSLRAAQYHTNSLRTAG